MQIQICWLLQKPTDLDLHCLQCSSRSVGFFRSQLIWIYTVCKGRTYPGSAGLGLSLRPLDLQSDKLQIAFSIVMDFLNCDSTLSDLIHVLIIWCSMWKKCPYAIYKQQRSRRACSSMQSDLDILCSSTYTTISIDSLSGQWRSWSACANVQADQDLHCQQIA